MTINKKVKVKNPKIQILSTEIISQKWATLKKVTYNYSEDNISETHIREVYDRGDGVTILLYNKTSTNIILTRQLRLPTYFNGNSSGMLIETCAGTLEEENPAEGIIRETQEETGYEISNVEKIFEAYMSPGSVTEMIHFYIANYDNSMKTSEGGGLETEHEHIQVLEISFDKAFEMIKTGEIKDAKTIMLLQYAKINLGLSKN